VTEAEARAALAAFDAAGGLEREDAERQAREAAERELAEWMAGGPLARVWRALVYQRR
jgi:hypothetical protein